MSAKITERLLTRDQCEQNKVYEARGPNGEKAIGTHERIFAMAYIDNVTFRSKAYGFEFNYTGDTKVDWDSQDTMTERVGKGRRARHENVWVLETGKTITEDQLRFVEVAS